MTFGSEAPEIGTSKPVEKPELECDHSWHFVDIVEVEGRASYDESADTNRVSYIDALMYECHHCGAVHYSLP